MAILEPEIDKLYEEEVSKKKVISERFLTKIGKNLNALSLRVTYDIGDIIPTPLTEAQFISQHGVSWQLCNGTNIENSELAARTGTTTAPNIRGYFLRQQNELATGDDPERTLNSFDSSSDNKSHFHRQFVDNPNGNTNVQGNMNKSVRRKTGSGTTTVPFEGSFGEPNVGTSQAVGGAEARPTNYSVNYFIKIDL